jgi:hypothetical protein
MVLPWKLVGGCSSSRLGVTFASSRTLIDREMAMKKLFVLALAALLVMSAVAVSLAARSARPVQAQGAEAFEYGLLQPVRRKESYEIDLSRWAAGREDKDFYAARAFVYEEGTGPLDRQLNYLRKLNELAAQGWEMADAPTGLIRRRR